MTIDDLRSALGAIVNTLVEWLDYLRHPFSACERILANEEPDQVRVKHALTIWLTSFLISVVVLTPLYYAFGITLTRIDFHISVFLFTTLTLLLIGGIVHFGLRRWGIKSSFGDTLVIYSIFFGTYSPLIQLLSYPAATVVLLSLRASKVAHLGLADTVASAYHALSSPSPVMAGLFGFAQVLLTVASFWLTGMFAESAAKAYSVHRQSVLSSMSFSIVVLGIVPTAIAGLFIYYVMFAFMT